MDGVFNFFFKVALEKLQNMFSLVISVKQRQFDQKGEVSDA